MRCLRWRTIVRDDDKEDTIKERFRVYHEETEPLREYYAKCGILVSVDGCGDIDSVCDKIKMCLLDKGLIRGSEGSMIILKSKEDLAIMAMAGQIAGKCLTMLGELIKPGIYTRDLDKAAEEFIRSEGGYSLLLRVIMDFRAQYARQLMKWLCTAFREMSGWKKVTSYP